MSTIERKEVESSNIHSVGYDADNQILEVQFWRGKNEDKIPGDVYRYFQVPKEVVDSMLEAESVGRYFHANVRTSFQYEKVSVDPKAD